MNPSPANLPATLLIDDQGAALYRNSGDLLGWLPEAAAGAEKRTAWAAAIQQWVAAGTEIQILVGHSGLLIQCQEAPYLSGPERREVAHRVFAAETSSVLYSCAGALDEDPAAADGGGHVLWMAAQPRAEMDDWLAAIQMAGCVTVFIAPFQRALVQGMASLGDLPTDRVVLAMDPSKVGHLCIFHGQSLALHRNFLLPPDQSEAEELIFEEVSRLLQFFKQRNRLLVFHSLEIMGLSELSAAFQKRIQATLALQPGFLAPYFWPVLMDGLARERSGKDGLNLLPLEIQEARQRNVFRNLVWGAFLGMGTLLVLASMFLFSQEALLDRELQRSEKLLAEREAHSKEEERIVGARLPLLRNRLAERRQVEAVASLGALGLAVFAPPAGIQLEKVEILEAPGDELAHSFEITGLAFTEKSFAVGPLAQYLQALGRERGVRLEPVSEVTISDRLVAGREPKLEQLAIARFTLKGSAK